MCLSTFLSINGNTFLKNIYAVCAALILLEIKSILLILALLLYVLEV